MIKKVHEVTGEEDENITFNEFERDYLKSLKKEESIGFKIKIARLKKKISQTELSRLLEMKQPQLSAIEKGKHIPSMNTLKKIAAVLGVDVEELI